MADPRPRPRLSPADQASTVRRIATAARADGAIVRCDGTLEELSEYWSGSDIPGWHACARVERGDLLLSTVRAGRERLVVSLCLVEGTTPRGIAWHDDSDVRITSMPTVAQLLAAAEISQQSFRTKSGSAREDIIDALADLVANPPSASETEYKESRDACSRWERSRVNRQRKLEESDGQCECCGVNLRAMLGAVGDRGLEVHHRHPLSAASGVQVQTSLTDLAVLCATCHRLVHTEKSLRIEVVAARWAVSGADL